MTDIESGMTILGIVSEMLRAKAKVGGMEVRDRRTTGRVSSVVQVIGSTGQNTGFRGNGPIPDDSLRGFGPAFGLVHAALPHSWRHRLERVAHDGEKPFPPTFSPNGGTSQQPLSHSDSHISMPAGTLAVDADESCLASQILLHCSSSHDISTPNICMDSEFFVIVDT